MDSLSELISGLFSGAELLRWSFSAVEHGMRDGFECFVAGFLCLPMAAGFLATVILTIILTSILIPLKIMLGIGGTVGFFLPAAIIFLLALRLYQGAVVRLLNRLAYRASVAIPLEAARDVPFDTAGFKAAGLGALAAGGLNIAPGFVVNGRVFRNWAKKHGLEKNIREIAGGADSERAVRELLARHPLPGRMEKRLARAIKKFKGSGLILRSSFTDEDGSKSSMAGTYRSEKVAPGADAWKAALADVWASCFSQSAAAARRRSGATGTSLCLPVIIQAAVDHSAAFICCSVNMLNGLTEEMVIEYESAAGVAGVIVLNELTKSQAVLSGPAAPPFDSGVIPQLRDALLKMESEFGRPVQMEAGLAGDALFFYQVRPLTGFEERRTLVNSFIVDLIAEPLTPLSESLFMLPGSVEKAARARFGPFGLSRNGNIIKRHAGSLYLDYNLARRCLNPYRLAAPRFIPATIVALARICWKSIFARATSAAIDMTADIMSAGRPLDLAAIRDKVVMPLFRIQFDLFGLADALGKQLENLIAALFPEMKEDIPKIVERLKKMPEGTPYASMLGKLKLLDASDAAQAAAFRDEFGHWGFPESEIAAVRIAENPDALIGPVSARTPAKEKIATAGESPEARMGGDIGTMWRGYPLKTGGFVYRFLLNRYRETVAAREKNRDRLNRAVYEARKKALAAGRGEDVFFMTVEEALGEPPAAAVIEERKKEYAANRAADHGAIIHIPEIPPCGETSPDEIACLGVGAGTAESAALLADSPAAIDGPEKPILVLSGPDGAFGPMLDSVAALVLEKGSPLSHLVLLAREAGLPVLVGAADARKKIKSGDRILVDAAKGLLKVLR